MTPHDCPPAPALLTPAEHATLREVKQGLRVPDTPHAQQALSYLHACGLLSQGECDRASRRTGRARPRRALSPQHTPEPRGQALPRCVLDNLTLPPSTPEYPRLGLFIPGDAITAEHFRHLGAAAPWSTRRIEGESELLELVYSAEHEPCPGGGRAS